MKRSERSLAGGNVEYNFPARLTWPRVLYLCHFYFAGRSPEAGNLTAQLNETVKNICPRCLQILPWQIPLLQVCDPEGNTIEDFNAR
jgi:hypothetical protein